MKGLILSMVFFILLRQLLAGKEKDKEMNRSKKKLGVFKSTLGEGVDIANRRAIHFARKNADKPRKQSPIDDIKLPDPVQIPEWKGK